MPVPKLPDCWSRIYGGDAVRLAETQGAQAGGGLVAVGRGVLEVVVVGGVGGRTHLGNVHHFILLRRPSVEAGSFEHRLRSCVRRAWGYERIHAANSEQGSGERDFHDRGL